MLLTHAEGKKYVNDPDIRKPLIRKLSQSLNRKDRRALLIEEFGLSNGSAILDIGLINTETHGFEIKSEADCLARLPRQSAIYGHYFRKMTVVVASRHLLKVGGIVPTWWGIWEATWVRTRIALRPRRSSRINPDFDPSMVLEFLWKDEALQILEAVRLDAGIRGKNRRAMLDRIALHFPPEIHIRIVRHILAGRTGWKPEMMKFGKAEEFDLRNCLIRPSPESSSVVGKGRFNSNQSTANNQKPISRASIQGDQSGFFSK